MTFDSHGEASDPITGHTVVTFADDCPGGGAGPCPSGKLAVHEAVNPTLDDAGNVVLPQFYALCCDCHLTQYIAKYGIELAQPCGCANVDLQKVARDQRSRRELAAATVDPEIAAFRAELAAKAAGTVTASG